ncbi:MAG: hypothetical protein ACTHLH_08945, partial [Solirubrobacterales bacterium]
MEPISSFGFEATFDLFPTELASPSRDSVVYETYQSPLLSPGGGNGNFDLYEAVRGGTGWTTERRLTPSGEQAVIPNIGGVSSDHTYNFFHVSPVFGNRIGGSLAGELGADYLGKPDGSLELVGKGSKGEEPLAQGRYISEGGGHVIFSTGKQQGQSIWCESQYQAHIANPGAHPGSCEPLQLEPNAAPTGTGAIYDREADGSTHVISLLPGATKQLEGQQAFYQGASKSGTSIAFKIAGNLYVRINSGGAGEETEEAAPAADNPVYAGLSQDGKYLFYVAGGNKGTIHRFETGTEEDEEVNPGTEAELVNVSADGSHAYFISEEEIGGEGTAGQPNLFVWNGTTTELVATVAASDLVQTSVSPIPADIPSPDIPALTRWTSQAVAPVNTKELGPGADSSRTTPNGEVIVFESKAKLTAYDNAGHSEVYRWEEGGPGVQCVSCVGAPEPAEHDARLQELELVGVGMVVHNVTDDGTRVFFETEEALTGADTDATNDVYEWHSEELGPSVGLISSGRSKEYELAHQSKGLPTPNVLYSVTPDAKDVLFSASDALVPGAGEFGTQALYDARVGGGFAQPAIPRACSEEECKGPGTGAAPSGLQQEKSSSAQGPGNLKPKKKHRCHKKKGKKGKSHCPRHGNKKHKSAKKRAASPTVSSGSSTSATSASSTESSARPAPQPAASANAPSTGALNGNFNEFGIKSLSGSLSTTAAGQHPDFNVNFNLNHTHTEGGEPWSDAHAEEVSVSLPPGLLGNPNAVPKCEMGQFVAFAHCPTDAQVGVAHVLVSDFPAEPTEPIYNLTPPHPDKEVARLGFFAVLLPIYIDVNVRTASDYGVTATVHTPPSLSGVLASQTTFWGNPADSSHDELRLTSREA